MTSSNAGCLGFLLGLLGFRSDNAEWTNHDGGPWSAGAGSNGPDPLPYRVRHDFISLAEGSFYHVLRQAAGDRYAIFAKVGLAEIFFVHQREERRAWHNRIDRKHVDFLLFDALTLQPVAGIELDDGSHNRPDRQARDRFVDEVFEAAGLPLVHVPARRSYTLEDVRDSLRIVAEMAVSQVAAAAPVPATAPTCPRCGVPLVMRTAQKGRQAGGQFWGCPHYPRCRHTEALY